ncbi:MAG: WG repeat-containing protein [Ruminococcaceae bacterium]|nr:WG repeat-containing protein [Oscillospiraceae bacterium]
MNSSKIVKFGISAFIFLIVAALLLHVATIIVDFYDGIDKDKEDVPGTEDTVQNPEDKEENPNPPNNDTADEIKYVTNLALAPGASFVEGLYTDISLASETEISDMYKKLTEKIPQASGLDSVKLSSVGVYRSGDFTLAKSDIELPNEFSVGSKTVQVAVKYTKGTSQEILIKYEDAEADIKAVELYMGYIILNAKDGTSALYNENGEKLADLEDKTPANKRTYDGTPVFKDAKNKNYIFNTENKEFEAVSDTKIVYGLEYDYPAYSYKTTAGVHIYASYVASKKVYTYLDAADEKQEINTNYSRVYNFGPDGYALVKLTSGSVRIINSTGKTVHTSPTTVYTYYPEGSDAGYSIKVQRYYALPYLNDISAIGSGTVDKYGWMRIRIQLKGRSPGIGDKIVGDYETLVDTAGNLFEIPEGYTLEGYSDGVLLLSKNGLYGYYSIEEKWIANPIYTFASPFVQGLAAVGYEDGTVGMIDTKGNIVLPFAFRYVSNVSSGLVAAYSDVNGWEIFKLMENEAEAE